MDFLKKKEQVLNGEYNALELYSELSDLEKAIKAAKDEILEDAITEFEKHGAKSVKEYGFEISATQSGRYDYSSNQTYMQLKNQMKDIEDKMKAAYSTQSTILDDNTGEVYEPASYKASKVSLKFKKLK